MPRTLLTGVMYDADSRILDLALMQKIIDDPENNAGRWYTRQPWRAEITFSDNQWHFDSFLGAKDVAHYSDPDLFTLISTVLEELGA